MAKSKNCWSKNKLFDWRIALTVVKSYRGLKLNKSI